METFGKRTFTLGTALAALFVGASLCATPASALTPSAHGDRFSAAVFARHDKDAQNRDRDDYTRRDNGNHYGWDKQQDRRNRDNNTRQYYHRTGDGDRDDNNNSRNNGGYHGDRNNGGNGNSNNGNRWNGGQNDRGYNNAPPPPYIGNRRNGR